MNYLTATDPLTEEEFRQLVKGDTLKSREIGVKLTVIATDNLFVWGFDGSHPVTYLYSNVTPTGKTLERLRPWLFEGTREWAAMMAESGKVVTHESFLGPKYYVAWSKESFKKAYNDPKYGTGWSLYEPKPEPTKASALDEWIKATDTWVTDKSWVEVLKEIRDRLAALEAR